MSGAIELPSGPPAYRALVLQPDGIVVGVQNLIATDDEEALALAKAMVDGHAIEVWDGLRFIEHFDAETPPKLVAGET